MDAIPDWSVFELRQYTLHAGQRDVLIALFDREFVESQEATGMWLVGQFRDLDRPDRFVWVRGFRDMASRKDALSSFYGGPVWRSDRDAANATMIDSDDVLLLRPALPGAGFPPAPPRPAPGEPAPSLVTATVCHADPPAAADLPRFYQERLAPALRDIGAVPVACLKTEPAENTFPALPVRAGEPVLVWFSRFASEAEERTHAEKLEVSPVWRELLTRLPRPPQRLRLSPTGRSELR